MAEWSKALVLGTSLFGGVGSNPTAANPLRILLLLKAANAREILIPHLAVQRGHVTILLLFFSSKRHKYSSLLPLFVSNPLL